jgi:hypothetical protein
MLRRIDSHRLHAGTMRMDLFVKVSIVCPHCQTPRPGERAQLGKRIVTLCYCTSCGVTWHRNEDAVSANSSARVRRTPEVMHEPAPDDLLLRGSFEDGYELLEVGTGARVAAGLSTLDEVSSVAQAHGGEIWQHPTDRFGRLLGKPIRVSLRTLRAG